MPWNASTKTKICLALGLPIIAPAYVEYVERALIDAEAYGGATAVSLIEGYLAQYEAAQTAVHAESANAGLIRADVLEWQPGARVAGHQQEMQRLRRLIADALAIKLPTGGNRIPIRG